MTRAPAGGEELSEGREHLLNWLRDAHAMEQQAETMLSSQIERIENYPKLKARMEEHLLETRQQAEIVARCIRDLGGDTSAIKDLAARTVAVAQGLSGLFVGDEIVKGSLASYTFEQMEIASYRILISAAEALGEHEVAAACRGILAQEEAMASWLEQETPATVWKFLKRSDAPGLVAKH